MGHYASEMGYNSDAERIRRMRLAHKLGFSTVNSYTFYRDALECGRCGAVVLDFEKHHEVCCPE